MITGSNELLDFLRKKLILPDNITHLELSLGLDEIPKLRVEFFAEKKEEHLYSSPIILKGNPDE